MKSISFLFFFFVLFFFPFTFYRSECTLLPLFFWVYLLGWAWGLDLLFVRTGLRRRPAPEPIYISSTRIASRNLRVMVLQMLELVSTLVHRVAAGGARTDQARRRLNFRTVKEGPGGTMNLKLQLTV
jgi:hypothetical protein